MRMLITAGPTREYFDTVRFISNGSSGRMGCAIAAEARRRGHDVVLIAGPLATEPPPVTVRHVTSAQEMLDACRQVFNNCNAAIMTAAVSDWRPAVRLDHKAPKTTDTWQVRLEPTPDILSTLAADKGNRIVIGFAVQDQDAKRRAERKMTRKRCDAIVLNSPEAMGGPTASISIKVENEPWSEPVNGPKDRLAAVVVDLVERLVARRGG